MHSASAQFVRRSAAVDSAPALESLLTEAVSFGAHSTQVFLNLSFPSYHHHLALKGLSPTEAPWKSPRLLAKRADRAADTEEDFSTVPTTLLPRNRHRRPHHLRDRLEHRLELLTRPPCLQNRSLQPTSRHLCAGRHAHALTHSSTGLVLFELSPQTRRHQPVSSHTHSQNASRPQTPQRRLRASTANLYPDPQRPRLAYRRQRHRTRT